MSKITKPINQNYVSQEKVVTKNKQTKSIKAGKCGKVIIWNKGNSEFIAKKEDIGVLLHDHQPIALGILEANIGINCHKESLIMDGYSLELDNLEALGEKSRSAVYLNNGIKYQRRKDLEPNASPVIWIEINPGSPTAWLLFIGYREWRCLHEKNKKKVVLKLNRL